MAAPEAMAPEIASVGHKIPESFSKIVSWPVVSTSWTRVSAFYQATREYNRLLQYTLTTTEASLNKAFVLADPLIAKLEPQISKVDEYTFAKLSTLEEKLPIVKRAPDQVVTDTIEFVSGTLDAGKKRVHDMVATKLVLQCMDMALVNAEGAVDLILPDDTEGIKEDSRKVGPLSRVQNLGSLIHQRACRKAMLQLVATRERSRQALQSLAYVNVVMDYSREEVRSNAGALKTSIQDRLGTRWAELTKCDGPIPEGETTVQKYERVALIFARNATKDLLDSLNLATSVGASLLPVSVQGNLNTAQTYVEDLFGHFSMVNGVDQLPFISREIGLKLPAVIELMDRFLTQPLVNSWLGRALLPTYNVDQLDADLGELTESENESDMLSDDVSV